MTKDFDSINLKINIQLAAQLRKVLFDYQKDYSYEFPSEGVNRVRQLIVEIDNAIEEVLRDPDQLGMESSDVVEEKKET